MMISFVISLLLRTEWPHRARHNARQIISLPLWICYLVVWSTNSNSETIAPYLSRCFSDSDNLLIIWIVNTVVVPVVVLMNVRFIHVDFPQAVLLRKCPVVKEFTEIKISDQQILSNWSDQLLHSSFVSFSGYKLAHRTISSGEILSIDISSIPSLMRKSTPWRAVVRSHRCLLLRTNSQRSITFFFVRGSLVGLSVVFPPREEKYTFPSANQDLMMVEYVDIERHIVWQIVCWIAGLAGAFTPCPLFCSSSR